MRYFGRRLGKEFGEKFSEECVVGSAAFDSNRSGGNALGFVGVAEHCGEDFKWRYICIDMIATIHSQVIMFCCHLI